MMNRSVEQNLEMSLHTMEALHNIGCDLREKKLNPGRISVIVHGPYSRVCPKDLSIYAVEEYHRALKREDSKMAARFSSVYMDLAAWEITSGQIPVHKWTEEDDLGLLQNLSYFGQRWHEVINPEIRKNLCVENPLGVHYIDLPGLVVGVVDRYDKVMAGDDEDAKAKYRGLGLNDKYISIGQNLIENREVPVYRRG